MNKKTFVVVVVAGLMSSMFGNVARADVLADAKGIQSSVSNLNSILGLSSSSAKGGTDAVLDNVQAELCAIAATATKLETEESACVAAEAQLQATDNADSALITTLRASNAAQAAQIAALQAQVASQTIQITTLTSELSACQSSGSTGGGSSGGGSP